MIFVEIPINFYFIRNSRKTSSKILKCQFRLQISKIRIFLNNLKNTDFAKYIWIKTIIGDAFFFFNFGKFEKFEGINFSSK